MKDTKKRDIFALDLSAQWKKALQEKVLPLYPNFKSMAALGRQALQEFILCHLTEAESHTYGLLATYQSMGKPDALLFAIGRSEELRRQVQGESGEQAAVEPVRRKAGGRR